MVSLVSDSVDKATKVGYYLILPLQYEENLTKETKQLIDKLDFLLM